MERDDVDPSQPAQASPRARSPKSPALAAVLALILPGIGQVYLGQTVQAFVIVLMLIGCVYGVTQGALFPFLFLAPFIYLLGAVDAHRGAMELNERAARADGQSATLAQSPWWGAGLIVLGTVLLLHSLGWVDLRSWQRFWPVALIAVGIAALYMSAANRPPAQGRTELPSAPGSY
jgi:TM2 domain-containing membrane protein YozV